MFSNTLVSVRKYAFTHHKFTIKKRKWTVPNIVSEIFKKIIVIFTHSFVRLKHIVIYVNTIF